MIMTRKNILSVKRIVVKIGTSSLILPNGKINLSNIEEFAFVLSDLNKFITLSRLFEAFPCG